MYYYFETENIKNNDKMRGCIKLDNNKTPVDMFNSDHVIQYCELDTDPGIEEATKKVREIMKSQGHTFNEQVSL